MGGFSLGASRREGRGGGSLRSEVWVLPDYVKDKEHVDMSASASEQKQKVPRKTSYED